MTDRRPAGVRFAREYLCRASSAHPDWHMADDEDVEITEATGFNVRAIPACTQPMTHTHTP